MKDRKEKSRVPILAAGGIVLRHDRGLTPQFAVVHSRKLEWGLPKGKLAEGEDAMTAARREVLEETGQRVTVHEFLGTLAYETNGRPKVIQFWRMEAVGEPAGRLMPDVKGVYWLPLDDAVSRLTHLRERVFLEQVGPVALKLAARRAESAPLPDVAAAPVLVPGVPLAPAVDASLPDASGEAAPAAEMEEEAGDRRRKRHAVDNDRLEDNVAGKGLIGKILMETGLDAKTLMQRTLRWFRHAALLLWQPLN
jgi:8-oxo-dGTP diphosphatase